MNKHLLQTRLKSITHYSEELKKLSEAHRVVTSTREELKDSLKEFFPFKDGDVIVQKGKMRKILSLKIIEGYADPAFRYLYMVPYENYGDVQWKKSDYMGELKVSEFDNWKLIDDPGFV